MNRTMKTGLFEPGYDRPSRRLTGGVFRFLASTVTKQVVTPWS